MPHLRIGSDIRQQIYRCRVPELFESVLSRRHEQQRIARFVWGTEEKYCSELGIRDWPKLLPYESLACLERGVISHLERMRGVFSQHAPGRQTPLPAFIQAQLTLADKTVRKSSNGGDRST